MIIMGYYNENIKKVVGDEIFSGTQNKKMDSFKLVMEQYYSWRWGYRLNRFKKNLLHMLKNFPIGHTSTGMPPISRVAGLEAKD